MVLQGTLKNNMVLKSFFNVIIIQFFNLQKKVPKDITVLLSFLDTYHGFIKNSLSFIEIKSEITTDNNIT